MQCGPQLTSAGSAGQRQQVYCALRNVVSGEGSVS